MTEAKENKKTNVLLVGGIALIVLAFIIYLVYNHFKDKPVTELPPVLPPPGGSGPPKGNDNFPLTEGSVGSNVKFLQEAINRIVSPALKVTVDSNFGPKLYTALVTGVGTTTWWTSKPAPIYPVTQSVFTEILKKSNANRVMMGGRVYEFTNN